MSRLVLIGLQGLLDLLEDGGPAIEAASSLLAFLDRSGAIPIRNESTIFEDQWFGLASETVRPLGPLCLAAFGRRVEIRETGLACAVLSHQDGLIQPRPSDARPEELAKIMGEAEKLQTRFLNIWSGTAGLGGIVIEGQMGGVTRPPKETYGNPIRAVLPEGDFARSLYQFIDDSVNLLDGLESNRIREEEGRPKLNLLWPFGNGFGFRLPSVPLQWGMTMSLTTDDLRFAGLGTLTGFDTQCNSQPFHSQLSKHSVQILVGKPLRGSGDDADEIRRNMERWDQEVWAPLLQRATDQKDRLVVIVTGGGRTLWSDVSQPSTVPWRVFLADDDVAGLPLHEKVSRTFRDWMAEVVPAGEA